TETLPADVMAGRPYMVGPKQRYAHDEAYVQELLKRAGFTQIDITGIIVRYDEGSAVPGHLVIARR
ncbi:MAG: S-adenosylmethionine-dependent methyltransferase, partial [Pseudomonadota bacterium]